MLLFLFACKSQKEIKTNELSSAKTIEDLFEIKEEIKLQTTNDVVIAGITDFTKTKNGDFVICDGWQVKKVFVFDKNGNFKTNIGGVGEGPGEFSTPISVTLDSLGNYYIYDYLQKKINIFDTNFLFKENRRINENIYYIRMNKKDEIFAYNGMTSNIFKKEYLINSIYKISTDNAISFAKIPKESFEAKMSHNDVGMALLGDFIYEMNPLYYNIRKYDMNGNLIQEFGKKIISKRIDPMTIHFNYGPFIINGKYILIQHHDYIDIYNTNGELLVEKIKFEEEILGSHKKSLFIKKDPDSEDNPSIIEYKFKY